MRRQLLERLRGLEGVGELLLQEGQLAAAVRPLGGREAGDEQAGRPL